MKSVLFSTRLLGVLVAAAAWSAPGAILELGASGKGTALVTDPAAADGKAAVLTLAEEGIGPAGRWPLAPASVKPGLYRLELALRLRLPPEFDQTRLMLKVSIQAGGQALVERHVSPLSLDAGGYSRLTVPFSVVSQAPLELVVSSDIAETPAGKPKKSAQPFKAPVLGSTEAQAAAAGKGDGLDDLMADMASEKAVSLDSIKYAALVLDRAEWSSVSDSLVVERVHPLYIHVYPGETNPVTVTVRNFGPASAQSTVRLTMRTGLGEEAGAVERPVTVPAGGTAVARFDWTSGAREFGHEARAEVLADGKTAHAASEYFTVSGPLWKTAIQGSGFITWFGREGDFPSHVANNRRSYINVEEAFSWQPSSWTDLNPTNSHWWTGQNNFHNSLSGLHDWMSLNHAEGIKMISYMWATASGPQGVDWARRHPDLVAGSRIGLGSEFHDVEDLRLYDLTHEDPAFEDYQYGVWHSFTINRGWLRLIETGADQLIRSAKNFGWDGVRFDSQLGWGSMGTADVKAELREMGAEALMDRLAPELMALTGSVWNAEAISIRNVRYMKHRLREGAGPHYEIASNYGAVSEDEPRPGAENSLTYFTNYCAGGSQVNQEYFRQMRSWKAFSEGLLRQVDLVRRAGGFHAVQGIDAAANAESRAYNNIFTFASGSHPYIYSEGKGSPGRYARFMTRYGEFLWDPALAPVSAEGLGVTVTPDAQLLWKPYVTRKAEPGGGSLTVIQLITPPRDDAVDGVKPAPQIPWLKQVSVYKVGTVEPEVWLLSGEPDIRAEKLPATRQGNGFTVTVPEHRLWSVLAWREVKP